MPSPTGNDLTLQGLPNEIVQRIGLFLVGCDGILELRAASQELEIVMQDLFIREYVAHQYCWALCEKRWKRIEDMLGSRLGEHIRAITITFDVLEHKTLKDLATVRWTGSRNTYMRPGS